MAANTIDVHGILQPDQMAHEIALLWDQYDNDRNGWKNKVLELRNFLYATDTHSTTVGANPFKNSTHTPKLAQIHQNLLANYTTHLFGNPEWINWEAGNNDAALIDKARTIESYMRTKFRQSNAEQVFLQLLDDWVQTGICFGRLVYCNESHIDVNGTPVQGYVGPRVERISTHDLVFNIAAQSWEKSPKIVRSLLSIGELARMAEDNPSSNIWTQEVIRLMADRRKTVRAAFANGAKADADKSVGFIADGFSDIFSYYNSDLVEILEFYGDWYDLDSGELLKNYKITVADRCNIVHKAPVESWTGRPYLYCSTWRDRPDNLMGMGPLDSLVGMQYKIDKLENLRADVFDQIANPDIVESGVLEAYGQQGAPGRRWVVDENGSVSYLRPDSTVLNADMQIMNTMGLMEELAGAPREAMGLRSPGEKTKFEVQVLDNGANRLFRHKVRKFETEIVEVILNDALEMARRNLDGADLIRIQDPTFGASDFVEITRDDIAAVGKLRARGSYMFEKQANAIQNLNMVFNSPVGQMIAPHVSRTKLAKVIEDLISAEQYQIISDNIGVIEDIQTQRIMQSGQEMLQEEAMTQATGETNAPQIGP